MVSSHSPHVDRFDAADAADAPDTPDTTAPRLPELLESYRALVRAHALAAHDVYAGELERKSSVDGARAGAAFALGAEDWVVGQGTELELAVARGATLSEFVAYAVGRGPNPWNARDRRTVASDLRNGAHITQGVGIGWGAKIGRRALAVLVTFTDDIIATGEFHNGVNFAGVFKVPAIFLCASAKPLGDLASAYGIATRVCDGTDFFAVAKAVADARKHAVAGHGPTLIEADVRPRGPRQLGQPDETALSALRRHLEARGLFNAEHESRLESAAAAEIALAVTEFVVPTGRRPE